MKNLWKGMLVFFMAMVICTLPQEALAKVKVKKVTVKSNYGSSVHVAVGKKVKLKTTVTVSPNKSSNKKVTYKSSNKKIATVSSSGYVKGIKTGKCKVTVTSKKNKKKKAKITINVVKKVTSIKIERPEKDLYVGNSVTLKTTVNPTSGSYKKLTWTTSDKSIATVTNTGKVTGLKAGTVTIKATSVEGSKKTASISLTILALDSVNISSVEVLSDNVVRVVLDKAQKLNSEQFVIEGKKYSFGSYIRTFKILHMRNYDDKTYDLTLESQYIVPEDSFVRVTINTLPGNGTKTMETQAIYINDIQPAEQTWLGLVGDTWEKTVDLSEYCYGNISYEVIGSIPGITIKERGNALSFSGKLTTVVVGADLTIKATDEMGYTITKKIHVGVADKTTIVGKAKDLILLVDSPVDKLSFVTTVGGSGKYTYSAMNLPDGMELDKETGEISGKATRVGEYTIHLTICDVENEKRTYQSEATICVVDQKKIVGTVKDTKGNALANTLVVCENVTDGTTYEVKTDETGAYTMYVGEGTYHMKALRGDNKDCVYHISVGSGGRQIHFILNCEEDL